MLISLCSLVSWKVCVSRACILSWYLGDGRTLMRWDLVTGEGEAMPLISTVGVQHLPLSHLLPGYKVNGSTLLGTPDMMPCYRPKSRGSSRSWTRTSTTISWHNSQPLYKLSMSCDTVIHQAPFLETGRTSPVVHLCGFCFHRQYS